MTTPTPREARRLHPLSPVLDGARFLPQLVILAIVGGAGGALTVPLMVGVAVVVVGFRYLAWTRTTYRIEDGALVLERGLLNRSRTVLPLDRVQQVDLQRKLRHQVTGLVVVRIDRAGGGTEAEVVLDAVDRGEAERLRAALRGAPRPGPTAAGPADPDDPTAVVPGEEPERELLAVPLRDVALAGVTGSKLLALFAALGAVFGLLDDVGGQAATETATDWVRDGARPSAGAIAVLVVVAVPLWLALAAGASILADGGFRLARRGDVLRVTRGVLDQREASLAVHRIQVVRIHENALRRPLGLVSVSLQSAGGSGSVEGSSTRVTVPLLRRGQVDALLAEVLPHAPALPRLPAAPPAARRRAWTRRVGPALVLVALAVVVAGPAGLAALPLVVLAAGAGELAYRALGWATVDGYLVTRRGGVAREVALVPVAKTQSTRLRSSPFQRRADLATLLVDVAGRGRTPAVVDGDGAALAALRHRALATTEARRDERAVRRRSQVAAVAPPTDPAGPRTRPTAS